VPPIGLMSRLLKILGRVVGGLAVLIALAAIIVYSTSKARLNKTYAVTPKAVTIPTDATALARGKHLAETRGCNDCHGKDFAGNKVIDDGAMGKLHAPNLTKGKGGRIATFTDADWVRAIRHGVGPDQHGLLIMPSEEYQHFADDDLGALIAYLKTVPAVDRERPATSLGPISRVLLATGKMKLGAEVIEHANVNPAAVTPAVSVAYGRYVAASCMGCHGPNFSGGKIEVGPPNWPHAANLTPHESGRLGKWSEGEFISTVRTAKRPDGTELDAARLRPDGRHRAEGAVRLLPDAPAGRDRRALTQSTELRHAPLGAVHPNFGDRAGGRLFSGGSP
jgi:mono/diheme cytochrome c family protein